MRVLIIRIMRTFYLNLGPYKYKTNSEALTMYIGSKTSYIYLQWTPNRINYLSYYFGLFCLIQVLIPSQFALLNKILFAGVFKLL